MNELLYITETVNGMWHIRLRNTHEVISCSTSREGIYTNLKTLVARYKTQAGLTDALVDMSERHYPHGATLERYKQEFLELDEDALEDTKKVVRVKAREVREDLKQGMRARMIRPKVVVSI